MNEENQGDSGAPESTPTSSDSGSGSGGATKPNVGKALSELHFAEKLLCGASLLFLLSFIVDNRWRALFKFGSQFYEPWKHTLGFVGALGVLALVGARLFGVKLVDAKLHVKLLVLCAILPALGLLIDELRHFWSFAMLAGIVAMAYAGAKITTREKIL